MTRQTDRQRESKKERERERKGVNASAAGFCAAGGIDGRLLVEFRWSVVVRIGLFIEANSGVVDEFGDRFQSLGGPEEGCGVEVWCRFEKELAAIFGKRAVEQEVRDGLVRVATLAFGASVNERHSGLVFAEAAVACHNVDEAGGHRSRDTGVLEDWVPI
ncbi:hypothetical protein RHS04_06444 [Rhizoctonia solani]|uniref:Uncharacterized protein n=1 Tax=Rhizoctonia solani TaxID=456999 RepID=A0A8H7LID0_9AGAM|nr:hypothetical protein RHS04_06444 [Rhizoctonia solani]